MQQLALTYDAATVGAADWDAELGWFRRAVDVIGHKEVAYRLDIAGSHLTDAMKEAERKNVHGRWISVVRRMAPSSLVEESVRLVCGFHGFEPPKRIRTKTEAEARRDERAWMEKNCPGLLVMMDSEVNR